MPLKIGDVLQAKGKPSYRLTGSDGKFWMAERLDQFESPAQLDAATITKDYKIAAEDAAPPPIVDDAAMAEIYAERAQRETGRLTDLMLDAMAKRDGVPVDRGHGWTPEQAIRAAQTFDPDDARQVAQEIAADEHRLADVLDSRVRLSGEVLRALRAIIDSKIKA
jgi:hypothetical protein